ncbi:hypothetical protein BKA83DRAFT_4202322, partial [Pisolithus microcarpus]
MERWSLSDATRRTTLRSTGVVITDNPGHGQDTNATTAEADMLGTARLHTSPATAPLSPSTFSQMPTAPLLRWSPSHNTSLSQSEGSSSRPHTPVIAALNEALSESILPRRPPSAALPLAFSPPRVLSRPPLLTTVRPTYPTASLSRCTPLSKFVTRGTSKTHLSDAHLPRCAPSIHTSISTQFTTSEAPSKWWFQQVGIPRAGRERLSVTDDIAKNFRAPKAPVVFCHGLLGFDSVTIGPAIAPLQVSHWRGIKEVLQDNGCEVLITRVPATSSPIDQTYPGRAVHLIAPPSQGGIDCRYLITHLIQRSFSVLSLTTIVTPHRGSTFANHFLSLTGSHLPAVLALLELLPNGGGDGKAFEIQPDVDGVRYFSWGADYEPGLFDTWKYPHSVIYAKEGPNDGFVSARSARWGTYLGTLKDVNHLDLVGWTDGIAGGLGLPMLNLRGMRAAVQREGADLLAGVEEEEGYVNDGVWVGSRGRVTPADEIRRQEPVVVEATPIQRTSSDKARARMEEVLCRTPSLSESNDGDDEEMDKDQGSRPMPPHEHALKASWTLGLS